MNLETNPPESLDTGRMFPDNDGMTSMTATFPRRPVARPTRAISQPCGRCDGAGGNHMWPGFTCYRCGGLRVDPTRKDWAFPQAWSDEQCAEFLAKKEAAAQARKDAADAKRRADWEANREQRLAEQAEAERRLAEQHAENRAANLEACPALAEFAQHPMRSEMPGFLHDIASQAEHFRLSPRQVQVFAEVYAKNAKRHTYAGIVEVR